MRKTLLALPAALSAGALFLGAASASGATMTVVANHLNNPRQLSIDAQGNLYVAEAGKSGTLCPKKNPCAGLTSSIAKIPAGGGAVTRILKGASYGDKTGAFTVGLDGVSVAPDGTVFAQQTYAPLPDSGVPRAIKRYNGRLLSLAPGASTPTVVANIASFEFKNNPDKGHKDSDPYAVLALNGHQVVADAAGNDLLDVVAGKVSVIAVFPKTGKRESVPISIAQGPDGAYYVGELPGEPTPKGAAHIWKVVPDPNGGKATLSVFATNLNGVAGLAFGPDGSLYATEMSTNPKSQKPTGAVVKFSPDGTTRTTLASGLAFPAGLALGPDGSVYVSNASVLPATTPKKGPFKGLGGQVVKITP